MTPTNILKIKKGISIVLMIFGVVLIIQGWFPEVKKDVIERIDKQVSEYETLEYIYELVSIIMKKLFSTIIILLIAFQFSSQKKIDDLQFEKNVLNEVFEEIAGSIYRDRRIMIPPPMPRIDFKTNKEDTVGFHNRLNEYYRFQDSIKKDTTRILLAVYDSVKTYKNNSFKKSKTNYVNDYKLDLNLFKNNKKFNFKSSSLFPSELYWDINDLKSSLPVGVIYVCRIQFNNEKIKGTLEAASSCGGGKCGQGYIITIEYKSGHWKVSKIKETWMS